MVNLSRTVVTIDGLAASGKSTLAKLLAKELGYMHVNTGLLYRAVALLAIEEKIEIDDIRSLVALLSKYNLCFDYSPEKGSCLLIDGLDRSESLQSQEVASFTSKIAAIAEIREALKLLQLQAFPEKAIVAEGRDTGTIIFPHAAVKFFIDGDPLVRASRRALDLKGQLSEDELKRVTYSVAEELRERDERDTQRKIAPLIPASDAHIIDNSKGELKDTVQKMVELVRKKSL